MVLKYFGTEARALNFIFKTMLVIILAQQIYYPQTLKYMHLALLFIFILFLDVYKEEYRTLRKEAIFLALIFVCGLVSIIEKYASISLGAVYLISLAGAVLIAMDQIMTMIKDSKDEDKHSKFGAKHFEAVSKSKSFVILLFYMVISVMTLSLLYCLYLLYGIIL
ncbi:MAG: hypothetical protein ACOZCL_01540 [Bacillota bacterium]